MRILQLHSDFIEYRPIQKEIPNAEEAEKKATRLDEAVVLFTAVEKGDSKATAQKAVDDVKAFLEKLKVNLPIQINVYSYLSIKLP